MGCWNHKFSHIVIKHIRKRSLCNRSDQHNEIRARRKPFQYGTGWRSAAAQRAPWLRTELRLVSKCAKSPTYGGFQKLGPLFGSLYVLYRAYVTAPTVCVPVIAILALGRYLGMIRYLDSYGLGLRVQAFGSQGFRHELSKPTVTQCGDQKARIALYQHLLQEAAVLSGVPILRCMWRLPDMRTIA